MKVRTTLCPYSTYKGSMYTDWGLEDSLNQIGYDNVLHIFPLVTQEGQIAYTIIYKDNEQ